MLISNDKELNNADVSKQDTIIENIEKRTNVNVDQ